MCFNLRAAQLVCVPTAHHAVFNIVRYCFNALKIDGIVMTMFDGRSRLSRSVDNDVRSFFKDLVYDTVIPRNVRIPEAPSHGKPVMLYDFRSTGAQSYIRLAGEILTREKGEQHG